MQITTHPDFEKACTILGKNPQAELSQVQTRIINEAKENMKEEYFNSLNNKTLTEIETFIKATPTEVVK